MKKFWKRRGGRDRNAPLAVGVSNDLQRELLKQVALVRDEENSSPAPVVSKRQQPVAHYKRELSHKSVDDNVSEGNDVDTLESTTIDSTTVSTRKPPITESLTNYKTKAMKAYSCFSGSVYSVATGMDTLLTSCSNTCCVQINDETTVYNSLTKNSTDSLTIDESTSIVFG